MIRIIGEITLDAFLEDKSLNAGYLNICNTVLITDGVISADILPLVLNKLRSLSPGRETVKLAFNFSGDLGWRHICKTRSEKESVYWFQQYRELIRQASYIDIDSQDALMPIVKNFIPIDKRIITINLNTPEWFSESKQSVQILLRHYQQIRDQVDANLYRLICPDSLVAMEFLQAVKAEGLPGKVIAYDNSEAGVWSRLCAAYKGEPVIFADANTTGACSLIEMQHNFALHSLPTKLSGIYGIAGQEVTQSLSPWLHNQGLRQLGIPALYLPFALQDADSLANTIQCFNDLGLPLLGLTVIAPLKLAVSQQYPAHRAVVDKTQSANVLRFQDGQICLDTTDDLGLLQVVKQNGITVKGKRVAILGCGGSGRVAAHTLQACGADVTLFNRTKQRGQVAQRLLQILYQPLNEFQAADFDVLINTIPFPQAKLLPFRIGELESVSVLIDFVYNPYPNALMSAARSNGIACISGLDMLKNQLLAQFHCLTSRELPALAVSQLENHLAQHFGIENPELNYFKPVPTQKQAGPTVTNLEVA